jgi:hypothetical protein
MTVANGFIVAFKQPAFAKEFSLLFMVFSAWLWFYGKLVLISVYHWIVRGIARDELAEQPCC